MSENTMAEVGRRPRRLRRGTAAVGMTAAVALGGLGFAAGAANAAGAGPAGAQAGAAGASSRAAAAAARVVSCNGGPVKRVQTIGSNAFTTFTGTVNLTPSPLVVAGPATGTDTLLLTWSSETQLRGNARNNQFDWIEGIIRVDGVPVTDVGPDQLALGGSPFYGSNATQACVKIKRGLHRITLSAKVVNTSGQAETGWLDDWLLRADVLD
jgi:hypothetical protein